MTLCPTLSAAGSVLRQSQLWSSEFRKDDSNANGNFKDIQLAHQTLYSKVYNFWNSSLQFFHATLWNTYSCILVIKVGEDALNNKLQEQESCPQEESPATSTKTLSIFNLLTRSENRVRTRAEI